MKRIYLLVLVLASACSSAYACDICGYGVANYNPFLFPHLSRSYLGLSYQHRSYHTLSDEGVPAREQYNAFLVTGQYALTKTIQLVALVPYQRNTLEDASGTQQSNGLGDISVLANYRVWNKPTGMWRHTILAGAGVKLPTGHYVPAKTEALADQNFQRGTGSTDYLLNGLYRVSYKQWILNASTSYKYNTTNKDHYRYGDMLTTGATLIFRKDLDGLSIAPYVQLQHERQLHDADHQVLQAQSGGHVLYTGGGVDLNTHKLAFGVNYQWAADQNLAQGAITVKPRLTAHVSFML